MGRSQETAKERYGTSLIILDTMISRSEAEWYAFLILALVAMLRIDGKFDKVMKELKELREKIDKK